MQDPQGGDPPPEGAQVGGAQQGGGGGGHGLREVRSPAQGDDQEEQRRQGPERGPVPLGVGDVQEHGPRQHEPGAAQGPDRPRAHEAEELEEADARGQGHEAHSEGRGAQEERGQEGREGDEGGAHPEREVAPEGLNQTGVIPP